jgi:hypothetical protein
MMTRLAFTTCAFLRHPYDHPSIGTFSELTERVLTEAEHHPAFLCRAGHADDRADLPDPERDWGRWGPFAVPRYYTAGLDAGAYRAVQTLSLWRDLDGVRCFVYSGLHVKALMRRHEWFERPPWPTYAAWWVADDEIPTWQQAASRLETLAAEGPTQSAFDLRYPFEVNGTPLAMSRGGGYR